VLREPPTHLGEMAKTIKAPTLLIHGNMLKGKKPLEQMDLNEQLNYFSVMAAKRFLANFGGTAELKLIEGADHACEDPDHIKQFVQYSTDWFAKWLKSAEINEL
jgi:alpha-beta hydrolase superfamily lysophospholipase